MQMLTNALDEQVVHGQWGGINLTTLNPGHLLHLLNDLGLLIRGIKVRNISRVENHVDVLHKRLILDLVVTEQENCVLALRTGLQ